MTFDYQPCACGCEEKYQSLFALLDDELTAAECEDLRQHLADCPECYARLAAEQQVRALVRKCCDTEAPATLRERISIQLRIEGRG